MHSVYHSPNVILGIAGPFVHGRGEIIEGYTQTLTGRLDTHHLKKNNLLQVPGRAVEDDSAAGAGLRGQRSR